MYSFIEAASNVKEAWEKISMSVCGSAYAQELVDAIREGDSDAELMEFNGTTSYEKSQGEEEEIFCVVKYKDEFWKIFGTSDSYGEEKFIGFVKVQMGEVKKVEWKEA